MYFQSTLKSAIPNNAQIDEFFLDLPNIPYVDLNKGDYDAALNVETTKILYALHQRTRFDYGASIPILISIIRQVSRDQVF